MVTKTFGAQRPDRVVDALDDRGRVGRRDAQREKRTERPFFWRG